MPTIIYDWGTRDDFLLRRLYPEAEIVEAEPLVDDDKILQVAEKAAQDHASEPRLWFFQVQRPFLL